MNAVGIIAEYNPLHNGHEYLIREARRLADCDAVVVAMSGNFVQRGAAAILDKWERAEHAIKSGADLVIEIPTYYVVSDAGRYALAGTQLLKSIPQLSHIAFGSEAGSVELLRSVSNNLERSSVELQNMMNALLHTGISYPTARSRAYAEIFASSSTIDEELECLNRPNDILAIEYLKNCGRLTPITVKRAGADYYDGFDEAADYQSASGIRQMILDGADVSKYVPEHVSSSINSMNVSDRLFDLIKYSIISMNSENIGLYPSGGEGIENRLKKALEESDSLEDLILKVKSKRYTYSRISRLLIQLLLGINKEEYNLPMPGYIRVLAMNERGQQLLSEYKQQTECNSIISNLSKDIAKLSDSDRKFIELDIKAGDIYNLLNNRSLYDYSEYRQHPRIL